MTADGFSRLSRRSLKVLGFAKKLRRPDRPVGSGELLAALSDDLGGPAGAALAGCGVDPARVIAGVRALHDAVPSVTGAAAFSPVFGRIMRSADGYARVGAPITTEHLLLGLLDEPDSVAATILSVLGVRRKTILTGLDRIDPILAARDEDRPGPIVVSWTESMALNHPPSVVWALIEPPEHAHLFDDKIVSGTRRRTEDGRELHELVKSPGGPGDRTILEVVHTVPGQSARVRQVEPQPRIPADVEFELTPTTSGTLLRFSYVLGAVAFALDARPLGRRQLALLEEPVRPALRVQLDQVHARLAAGWAPPESGDDDEPQ